ncbi:MAG: branched-chain amino acid ABC transporter permease [Limisphaerales bacterium]
MTEFFQQLINGLSLGAIYALIALGYTMVYGVLRFINFAHGDVFMLGAFSGFYLARVFPQNSFIGALGVFVVSMLICAVIGILIERFAYRPLRDRPKLTVLITAIGVSLFIENTAQHEKVFGAAPRASPNIVPDTQFLLGDVSINSDQVLVLVVACVLMIGLQFIVLKTKIGTAMRAVSFNAQAAALMGINNNIVISFTFGLGSALAAAGGILYAMNYTSIDPLMGILPGLKAFVAAVLGGIGNIPGAALGGLIMGVVETFTAGYISSAYRDAVAFGILILILIFKPSGLLGKVQVEKV